MCPSGLNRRGGLVNKGTEKGAKDKRHYTVDNYIDRNTNNLHMNAHLFWNNCNQYIYIYVQCVVVISVGIVSLSVEKFI